MSGAREDLPARLFERAGPLLDRLRTAGPYPTGRAVIDRARQILPAMSEAEQIAVINAHPRIGEQPERVKAQSAHSFREQGYDRDTTPPEVFLRLANLNEEYEQKFGFRFVVFVNRRPQQALIPVLEARLRGSRDEERRTALREILAIAEDRLKREEEK
ncbi:MAG TPA: 2-oxo-4-hydroxy-4-carboxy-5-ureidoimidazoline decarboxylase [Gemmatimonadales bacterium]|nr:2-oxo-4-hydroxy-4-carboxy-5-ureidoimidazoline decarboxylase [Gemmatimonadales bacterium]